MLELKDALLEAEGKSLFPRLSLMARDGQLTCITGAHGVGKTLLARVMVGLHPLDGGYVSIDGELLTPLSAPVFRKMTIFLPQHVEPSTVDFVPDISDLETIFAEGVMVKGEGKLVKSEGRIDSEQRQSSSHPSFLTIVHPSSPSLVIADDPDVSQLEYLKSQASQGRTVIVMSQRQEYLTAADQLITLEAL